MAFCNQAGTSLTQGQGIRQRNSTRPLHKAYAFLHSTGSAGAFGCVVEGPLLSLHPPVPGEKGFRSDNGHDFGQALLDAEAVAHQGPTVRLGQWHPFPQLAAQNLVLLPGKSFSLARSSLNSFWMVVISGAAERGKLAAMSSRYTKLQSRDETRIGIYAPVRVYEFLHSTGSVASQFSIEHNIPDVVLCLSRRRRQISQQRLRPFH